MSSLVLTAETLVGTPGAGQQEFSGTIFTGAPTATTRGIIPTEQFYRLNADLVGVNATGAQNILGVGVTLAGSTQYEFEAVILQSKTVGTTSHTVAISFGGTATLNNIGYYFIAQNAATQTSATGGSGTFVGQVTSASATVVTGAITSATEYNEILIKGTVSINAGGTFIPQYSLSVAPGGAYSTVAGSYMKIKPIGVSGANTSVGTWA